MRSVTLRRTTAARIRTISLFAVMILLFSACSTACSTWKRLRGDRSNAQTSSPQSPAAVSAPATTAEGPVLRLKGAKVEDGVVQLAGLRFQQCTSGQKPTARVCVGDAVSMNHFRADDYCKRLTLENLRWRLPTREELESILLKEQAFFPLTDPEVFPATRPMMYWTSSSFHGANRSFWTVDFQDGRARGETIFNNAYVRCVSAD